MGISRYVAFAVFALRAVSILAAPDSVSHPIPSATPTSTQLIGFAQILTTSPRIQAGGQEPKSQPDLAVSVSAVIPQSEVFGVQLTNGHATQALIDVVNHEKKPISVSVIGGALSNLKPLASGAHSSAGVIHNLTSVRYDVEIAAGEKQTLPFTFTADLHPQKLRLNIVAVVASHSGTVYQLQAFNQTISVVDAATSIFDPQMYVPAIIILHIPCLKLPLYDWN